MTNRGVPDQEAIDELRREARLEVLKAIDTLSTFVREDEGMGGIDAIRLGVFSQHLVERVRVYRMAVNIGDEPTHRALMADLEGPVSGDTGIG